MNQNEYDGSERTSWGFIGDCGGAALLEEHGKYTYITQAEQSLIWMKIGLAFLQHTFGEPPSRCSLGILWASGPHGPGKFPIIALGSDEWTQDVKEYFGLLEKSLATFDKAIDWSNVPRTNL